jgi:CobW/HypB/UreG, nucleotide-binding domain
MNDLRSNPSSRAGSPQRCKRGRFHTRTDCDPTANDTNAPITVHDLTDMIVPISGSCVCCGSRDKLLSTLEDFDHRPGRVVIIETNGTTDSEELIELLSLAPELERFAPPTQVSVIDGKRWQKRFWHNDLKFDQARRANHLFVSRTELVIRAAMGIVGATVVGVWAWGLLRDTSRVLLDREMDSGVAKKPARCSSQTVRRASAIYTSRAGRVNSPARPAS